MVVIGAGKKYKGGNKSMAVSFVPLGVSFHDTYLLISFSYSTQPRKENNARTHYFYHRYTEEGKTIAKEEVHNDPAQAPRYIESLYFRAYLGEPLYIGLSSLSVRSPELIEELVKALKDYKEAWPTLNPLQKELLSWAIEQFVELAQSYKEEQI